MRLAHVALGSAAAASTWILPCAKLALGAGMALAAGGGQVVFVNGRARIGGGKDFMHAVATGAIGGAGRTVLRRQAVVAGEESLHAVTRAVCTWCSAVPEAWHLLQMSCEITSDEVFLSARILCSEWQPVQVGSVAAPGGQGLAVNTFDDVAGLLFVALAAGLGQIGKIERRSRARPPPGCRGCRGSRCIGERHACREACPMRASPWTLVP